MTSFARFPVLVASVIGLVIGCSASPSLAWWDGGHMQIAYVAYKQLDQPVKNKVDILLRLNPDYPKWTAGITDRKTAKLYAFVHAATWADDIKTKEYNYTRDKVDSRRLARTSGMPTGTSILTGTLRTSTSRRTGWRCRRPASVDLVTQLNLMMAVLPAASGASDDVRSYDLVWILHLVGDAHQPLHGIGRFTQQIPNGDAGGNAEQVIPANGKPMALHACWDSIFGGYVSPAGAIFDAEDKEGLDNQDVSDAAAKIADPLKWIEESAEVAKEYVYVAPVSLGKNPVLLTRETNARNIALSRAALAAARLANLINNALR